MDPICLLRDSLWEQLYDVINTVLERTDAAAVTLLRSTDIVGEERTTTLKKKLENIRTNLQWQRRGHNKYVGHLMLDNMQTKRLFDLRKKVSHSYVSHNSTHM